MKKLSLNLDRIAVESFETETETGAHGRGTVQAHGWSECVTYCGTNYCGGTCFESCWTDC